MDKKNRLIFLLMFGMLFYMKTTHAQMHNNGALYIGANATAYMKTGEFSFGVFASTSTKKEDPKGVLSIASGAAIASGTSSQFVNGWVNTKGTGTFTFPVGVASPTNYYAPIQATPVSGSPGVSTAYFRENPNSIGTLDASLTSISLNEYWKIIGSNATVSLTWNNASAVPVTLNQLANITIAGFNISNNKWEAISSMVNVTSVLGGVSSVTSGSVTSSTTITLANYSAFSIGLKSLICPQLIYPAGTAITYNGSFSEPPTLADVVTINSSGSTGSFKCNSLVLNADIALIDGQNIEVVNGITGTGKIIMSSQASLVQRAWGLGVSSPTIELTKATRDTMHQFDYIYWGAPVIGDVFSQLDLAQASTANLSNAFDYKYKYVSGTGGGWQNLTATETGRGFITRVKPQAPFATGLTDYINLKFMGTANNGDITVDITNNITYPNGGTSHNLLANPYPSALDADKFLQGNTDIDGVIYIWKQQTASVGSVFPYNQADYIAYTRAGSTSPSSIPNAFLGKIASGQGFLVKALFPAPATVTFTNCMRLTDSNTDFNKFSETTPVMDRYKVNMVGDNGVFSQIVVSYLPQCTLGYDRMYDAGRNSVSTAQLYSIMENDGRKLAINARPSFADTDVVPLGVSKTGTVSENFTLSIQEKEGVFAVNTPIYVHDLLLNSYNDLTISDYTFSSDATLLNTRFELVYQNGTLNNPDFENSKATAFIKNGLLSVSATLEMKSIAVYDILGRNVLTISTNGLKTMTNLFPFTEGIYIAKITMQNGVIATTKLINKN